MVFLLVVILIAGLAAALFLLGFRLGGESTQGELARIRVEAAQAERRLRELTRQVFVAMSEHLERNQK
jgi:uncharacterized membrane protein YciS (DUF1049 family)